MFERALAERCMTTGHRFSRQPGYGPPYVYLLTNGRSNVFVALTKVEIMQNVTEDQICSLISARIQNAERSLANMEN